jgi:uncharacterized protein (DUF362 family)
MNVYIEKCDSYNSNRIQSVFSKWDSLFKATINPGDTVVIKPNWLAHSHKYDQDEWLSVITHPQIITAVLEQVLDCLEGQGNIIITDAPQTDSQFSKIMERMTPEIWVEMGKNKGVMVTILDLREDEWINEGDITVSRKKLPGDPKGSTECDLGQHSSFKGHQVSSKGYYGADYNKNETNEAHSNGKHKYRVSRTVIEADVFVNIPKLKTHKKAGITCSLKNLVGINTYKNYLPHHNEGTPDEGGDQFPTANSRNRVEGILMNKIKTFLHNNPQFGKLFVPVKTIGKKIFGDTREVVRSGNWFGNDTLWRMVLDLNKVLFYSNSDGSLRENNIENGKRYLTVIDGIIAGEGNGPEAPSAKNVGLIIAGNNPVAADAAAAKMMGLRWEKIFSIFQGFKQNSYPLINVTYNEINIRSSSKEYNKTLADISPNDTFRFKPHFGWIGHIEVPGKGLGY